MKNKLLIIILILFLLTTGCSNSSIDFKEYSLFDDELVVSLPVSLTSWTDEEIESAFVKREKPSYIFSTSDKEFQIDFVETAFPTDEDLLELLHDFKLNRLKSLDEITSVIDDGIYEVNGKEVTQIQYYHKTNDYNVFYVLTALKHKYTYIRVIYSDEKSAYWETIRKTLFETIYFDE